MGHVKAPDIPRPQSRRPDAAYSEKQKHIQDLNREIIMYKSRATGRTTRIVDEVIQQLYRNPGKWIALFDHYYDGRSERNVFSMVMRRMESEHPKDRVEKRRSNISTIEIRLVQCPDRDFCELKIAELQQRINDLRDDDSREEPKESILKKLKFW